MNQLKFKLLTETARPPTRAHAADAGLDIYADQDLFLEVGTTNKVLTGLSVQIPEGYVGKIEDRSGLASKGLRTGGGVIDSGFSGELQIIVHNLTNTESMESKNGWNKVMMGYRIKAGQRIAQLLLYKVEFPELVQVEELSSSSRGTSGLGSSGV